MLRGRGTGRVGRQVTEPQRGRSAVNSWNRGTARGRGRPLSGRPTNNRTGVAQITEMPEYEEIEVEQPSQNPEQDFLEEAELYNVNELGRNPRNDDGYEEDQYFNGPQVHPSPLGLDESRPMPTCTLSADNLIALLETQQGQAELCHQVNSWTRKHTGGERGPSGYRDNPNARHHKMFAPVIIGKHDGEYEHITMALLDSGNLLQQTSHQC